MAHPIVHRGITLVRNRFLYKKYLSSNPIASNLEGELAQLQKYLYQIEFRQWAMAQPVTQGTVNRRKV